MSIVIPANVNHLPEYILPDSWQLSVLNVQLPDLCSYVYSVHIGTAFAKGIGV